MNPSGARWGALPSTRWFAAGALLALAVAPLRADNVLTMPTTTGSEVSIKVASPAMAPPRFGFAPLRVSIENSASQERTWQFAFQVGSRSQFPGTVNIARSITVPAGQTRDTWVFVPLAEPSTPVGRVLAPGSNPGTISSRLVSMTKTPTGWKIIRELLNPSTGAAMATEETDINSTTGARSAKMTSIAAGMSTSTSTNTSTPPPGTNVTYVVDPATGNLSSRYSSSGPRPVGGVLPSGPTKVDVITGTSPSAGLSTRPGGPKVSISQTPVGTKVTMTYGSGPNSFSTEQEIDSTTGVITRTQTLPPSAGRPPQPPNFTRAPPPGTETTFTIDEATGNIRTNTRGLNDGSVVPKIIIVRAPSPGSAGGATLLSSTGPIGAPVVAGGFAPPLSIMVEVTGPGVSGVARNSFNAPSGAQMRPFAIAGALEPVVRGQLSTIVRGAPNLSVVEPALLPADWRVWSSFAGVLLNADDFATLDAGRRAALRGWVGLGGRLWLVPSASGGKERVEKIGAGSITTLEVPIATFTPEQSKVGVTAVTSGPSTRPVVTVDQRAIDFWVEKIQVYGATPGLPDRDGLVLEKTPLGEALQAPATSNTWLAVFLVAFAAVVGPVNLFVFAPAAKRYRLFYTTPLIAFAAAVLLGVTILLQDGRGGDGVRRALVVLLPGENSAAVFQEQVSLTGFLSHRTFALPDDVQMTMLPLEVQTQGPMFSAGSSAEFTRADGRAGGDWFRNRGRQAQLVERLTPTRGRIERVGTAPDGAPIAQSSLGTALREFVCVDEHEKFWTATEVSPGKRVTLTRASSAVGLLTAGGSKRFGEVLDAAMPKTAGHWRARGGASDLAPIATLDSVRWEESDVLFAGVLEGSPEKLAEAKP